MKKLFLLAVVFALVGGMVFAEVNVSIEVSGGFNFLEGTSAKKEVDYEKSDFAAGDIKYRAPDVKTTGLNQTGDGAGMSEIVVNMSGQTEDGKLGGNLRFLATSNKDSWSFGANNNSILGNVLGDGWVWWKPIDMFKLQIGTNAGDGEFGLDGIGGWGFYGAARSAGIISSGNVWGGGYAGPANINVRNAYYDGFNGGIILTLTPLEALTVNIGIPIFDNFQRGDKFGGNSEKIFKHTEAQVTYDIANIGTVGFSIKGDMTDKQQGGAPANDNPEMFLYFGLSAIENLGLDIGLGYKLPDSVKTEGYGTVTVLNPFYVGLGASYNAGAFGIKLRTTMGFGGNTTIDDDGVAGAGPGYEYKPESGDTQKGPPAPFRMLIDILPSYAVNDNLTVLLSAGLGIIGKGKYEKASNEFADIEYDSDGHTTDRVAWHIQPYISLKASGWWAPNFYAGFRIQSSGDSYKDGTRDPYGKNGDKYIDWAIPVGLVVSF